MDCGYGFSYTARGTDSIIKRAENGIFGYTDIPDEWYCAYQKWWKDRYNFSINKEWLIFTTGVIPAISSIIRKMTTPAENVVVMTPVYNMFLIRYWIMEEMCLKAGSYIMMENTA